VPDKSPSLVPIILDPMRDVETDNRTYVRSSSSVTDVPAATAVSVSGWRRFRERAVMFQWQPRTPNPISNGGVKGTLKPQVFESSKRRLVPN